MISDFHELSLAELSECIRTRALSPVALVESLLARIASLDAQINAFITLTGENARRQARAAEMELRAGRWRGPLHGIPFALKDIYETAGIRTTASSRILIDYVPEQNSTVVERLTQAGAILIGKAATHEFAHGGPSFDLPWPPARNPWNTECFTSGSSSGSAAAVAAGFVPLALGTDTGGSVRNPAAMCGLVGFKPTYGLVSRQGVIPNSWSFDTCGPLTWTVEDSAIALQVIAGHDPRDPASVRTTPPDFRAALTREIKGLRIGVARHLWEEDLPAPAETRAATEAAIGIFRDLGAIVENVRLHPLQHVYDVKTLIGEPEMFAIHENTLRQRLNDYGAIFLGRCLPACLMTAGDYVQAQRERRRIVSEMEGIYAKHDLLLMAGPYGPAPRLDSPSLRNINFWAKPTITTTFSVTGGPGIALCCGFSSAGLPLSIQLGGRPFDDATVLRAGHAYEHATAWRSHRPPLRAGAAPATNRPDMAAQFPKSDVGTAVRGDVARALKQAGLAPVERDFEQVAAAHPHIAAMRARLNQPRNYSLEPANVFTASGIDVVAKGGCAGQSAKIC